MRQEDNEKRPVRPVNAMWSRRAVIGLWVVSFVLGGATLAARWDGLMERLARPPVGEVAPR